VKQPAFEINMNLEWIKEGSEIILKYIKQGYEKPNEILERFK